MKKSICIVIAVCVVIFLLIILLGMSLIRDHQMEISDLSYSDIATIDSISMYSAGFTQRQIVDETSALAAVEDVATGLGIANPGDVLSQCQIDTVLGNTYYRFVQSYQGIPVYGRSVVVGAGENGESLCLSSNFCNEIQLDTEVIVTEEAVLELAQNMFGADATILCGGLTIYSFCDEPELCWQIDIFTDDMENTCFFSAKSGECMAQYALTYSKTVIGTGQNTDEKKVKFNTTEISPYFYSLVDVERNISVYTASSETLRYDFIEENDAYTCRLQIYDQNRLWVPITPLSNFSTDWQIPKAVTCMEEAATVYDFYKTVLSRQGFNGKNGKLHVVYDDYNDGDTTNAFSIGGKTKQETLLSLGTDCVIDLNTIAHEYTHAMEDSICGLVYEGESGALKEAYADIFSEIVEDWANKLEKPGDSCDWIISNTNRNLADPQSATGKICQYDYHGQICPYKEENGKHQKNCYIEASIYPDYYQGESWRNTTAVYDNENKTINDYGGVHYNCTVISHAAYLMWKGMNDPDAFEALSTEELAKLFYETLFTLPQNCNFSQFRALLQNTAEHQDLSKKQRLCVSNALYQVGVTTAPVPVAQDGLTVTVHDVRGFPYEDAKVLLHPVGTVQFLDTNWSPEEPITFPAPGAYELHVIDCANTDNQVNIQVTAVPFGGAKEITIQTACGVSKPEDLPLPETPDASQDTKLEDVSFLSDDPFFDHKDDFNLLTYSVTGGIREDNGGYVLYTNSPEFPVIASLEGDFCHDGTTTKLNIFQSDYMNSQGVAICLQFTYQDGSVSRWYYEYGSWTGKSTVCYLVHGADADYLVMETRLPRSSILGVNTYFLETDDGYQKEAICITNLKDGSQLEYTMKFYRENQICIIEETIDNGDSQQYLYYQSQESYQLSDDHPVKYETYEEAVAYIQEKLAPMGLSRRVGCSGGGTFDAEEVTMLYTIYRDCESKEIPLNEIDQTILQGTIILGVNPELSEEQPDAESPQSSEADLLLGAWDAADIAMRLVFQTTGTDFGITSAGIQGVDGTVDLINLAEGKREHGVYQIHGNEITITADQKETVFSFSCTGDRLTLGETLFYPVDLALISQLEGTWEGEEGTLKFGENNDLRATYGKESSVGFYAVLSETQVLIMIDGSYSKSVPYSLNGNSLELDGGHFTRNGPDISYAGIQSLEDILYGTWVWEEGAFQHYYVFQENGTYQYYVSEGQYLTGNATQDGYYEIENSNTVYLYPTRASLPFIVPYDAEKGLECSGGCFYQKVQP